MKYDLQIGEEAIEQLKDEIVQMRKQIKEMQAAGQPGAWQLDCSIQLPYVETSRQPKQELRWS